jgi:hypothetical protein
MDKESMYKRNVRSKSEEVPLWRVSLWTILESRFNLTLPGFAAKASNFPVANHIYFIEPS